MHSPGTIRNGRLNISAVAPRFDATKLAVATIRGALALAVLFALLLMGARPARAQTETVLHSFTSNEDGAQPYAGLVRDAKGNLYGTTLNGGSFGDGTVFEVPLIGAETVLHAFKGPTGDDGAWPYAGLVRDPKGNLYGATTSGGAGSNYGTVFGLPLKGGEEPLYSFVDGPTDGSYAQGDLVRDSQGNLYGTTVYGVGNDYGTVFQVTPAGKETVLYSFTGQPDGVFPYAGLIRDAKGNLYGTTYYGGTSKFGTVYQITSTGTETVLYSFTGASGDGANPLADLLRDPKGNLYGTTQYGVGGSCNPTSCGTVFELALSKGKWKETVIHAFSGETDGAQPYAGLIRDSKGNLYGTTFAGGANGYGTVFELQPPSQPGGTWTETVLYSFCQTYVGVTCTDGANPKARLVRDKEGNLYGTTWQGGSSDNCTGGCGTVFELIP